MTAYLLSTTSRSRPLAFTFAALHTDVDALRPARQHRLEAGGDRHMPEQPVPPTHSVDTPDDEPLDDQPNPGDPGPPVLRPSKKRVPDDERSPI